MTLTELLARIFGHTAHKSVTLSADNGMIFQGYESSEVIEMLQVMKSDAADTAHWKPGTE